jgi:predicted nucleic acid-binding protein
VIGIDASVCIKWFKSGERYDAEAQILRQRLARQEVEAVASEILSLEIVRGLKKARVQQPALRIANSDIDAAFSVVEGIFQTGILLQCPVTDVKTRTKEIEVALGLFMADALHLATAVHLGVSHFVTDDHHFLTPAVAGFAASAGLQVVNLPDLIAALGGPAGAPGSVPPEHA